MFEIVSGSILLIGTDRDKMALRKSGVKSIVIEQKFVYTIALVLETGLGKFPSTLVLWSGYSSQVKNLCFQPSRTFSDAVLDSFKVSLLKDNVYFWETNW
jgi:hypothetical protein